MTAEVASNKLIIVGGIWSLKNKRYVDQLTKNVHTLLANAARTELVDDGVAVAEAAGGAVGEVDAVGEVVGLGQRRQVVVVAAVDERVPEHEQRRRRRRRRPPLSRSAGGGSGHRKRGEEQQPQRGEEIAGGHVYRRPCTCNTPALATTWCWQCVVADRGYWQAELASSY